MWMIDSGFRGFNHKIGIMFLSAFPADAMRKHRFGMLFNIDLDIFPGIRIVPDFLAVHADR